MNTYLLPKPWYLNVPFFVSKSNYNPQSSVLESVPRAPEQSPPPSTPSDTETHFGRSYSLSAHLPGWWVLEDSGSLFGSKSVWSVGRGLCWEWRDTASRCLISLLRLLCWGAPPSSHRGGCTATCGTGWWRRCSWWICSEGTASVAAKKNLLPGGVKDMWKV